MPIPGHGPAAAPTPAPGTPPAATPPATPPAAAPPATPAAPAAPTAPAAPAHGHGGFRGWFESMWGLLVLFVVWLLGMVFGYWAYDHRRWGWAMAFGLLFIAVSILLYVWFDVHQERREAATAAPAATPPATPPAAAPAATPPAATPPPPATPCTPPLNTPYSMNGRVWQTDGTHTWVQDASGAWVLVP